MIIFGVCIWMKFGYENFPSSLKKQALRQQSKKVHFALGNKYETLVRHHERSFLV